MKHDSIIGQGTRMPSQPHTGPDAELQKELTRRRRLGRVWALISVALWLATAPPIIYAVARASPCATRFLPNWLLGGCP